MYKTYEKTMGFGPQATGSNSIRKKGWFCRPASRYTTRDLDGLCRADRIIKNGQYLHLADLKQVNLGF